MCIIHSFNVYVMCLLFFIFLCLFSICLFLLGVLQVVVADSGLEAWSRVGGVADEGVADEGATHGSLRRLAWGSKLGFAENGVNLGLGLCLFWV